MRRLTVGLAAVVVLVAVLRRLEAAVVVAPSANASVEAAGENRYPLLVNGGIRYQQVYAASEFSALTGPELITQITFRPDGPAGGPFTQTISNVQVSLSTTSAAPNGLDTTFANNPGPDNTVTYSGPITISSADAPGPGNTRAFDVAINLQTPFLYDPANGNLLLDVLNSDPGNHIIGVFLDAAVGYSDPVSRIVGWEGAPGATSGIASTMGLVTQFTTSPSVIPEPSILVVWSLLAALGVGCGWWRRTEVRTVAPALPLVRSTTAMSASFQHSAAGSATRGSTASSSPTRP